MKGKYNLRISNNKQTFQLELKRNVTVIKGKSGTGKTTLIEMLDQWTQYGRKSGIHCVSDAKIAVFDMKTRWEDELEERNNTIIFVDEYVEYVLTRDFAEKFNKSGNYIVIISRSGYLKWFNYSVDEIYEFQTDSRNGHITTQVNVYNKVKAESISEVVITEDSNSGYEMMQRIYKCEVMPANGNSSVFGCCKRNLKKFHGITVIADGAAFGAYIQRVINLQKLNDIQLILPESFEYLLLNTEPFLREVKQKLEATWDYCDSVKYISWEQYYTELLSEICREKYDFDYSKKVLGQFFKTDKIISEVKEQLYLEGRK